MSWRLIWFFGPSTAGKATLIRDLKAGSSHELADHLRLEEGLEICEASFSVEHRDQLSRAFAPYEGLDVPLLAKGQTHDMTTWRTPQELKTRWQQELVFVWADPAELGRRCSVREQEAKDIGDEKSERYWRSQSAETMRVELYDFQIPWVHQLGLPTICISTNGVAPAIGVEPPGWTQRVSA